MQKGSAGRGCHRQRSNWFDIRIYFEIYQLILNNFFLPPPPTHFAKKFKMLELFVELVAQLMSVKNHLLDTEMDTE